MVRIDTILAYCLVTSFIFRYRLSPGATPYWFFGLIFLALFLSLFSDLFWSQKKYYSRLKIILACFLVFAVIGPSIVSEIIVRHQNGPNHRIHDIILQLEAGIGFFLQGKNPYAVDYFDTPMRLFGYTEDNVLATNPALYHFVMPPFYLLFSTLFYFFSITFFQYFDGRQPLIFLFFGVLLLVIRSRQKIEKKLPIFFLLALSPATVDYFMEGRSDWFVFSFLFFAFYLLFQKRLVLASMSLAIAFGSKQSAWPIFPLWVVYLYFQQKGQLIQRILKVIKIMIPFFLFMVLIFLPFLLWKAQAFFDCLFNYLNGSLPTSYPISGYGFGELLVTQGFIKNSHQYYPFWIWQTLFCFPLFLFLINKMRKNKSVSFLIFSYALFLFVYWYFSRYFNNNHGSFFSLLLIAGWFFHQPSLQHEET